MKYVSTRDTSKTFEFKDVFIKGLADDGGLFVPKFLKKFSDEEIEDFKELNYSGLAKKIIYPFIGNFMSESDLSKIIDKSYSAFRKDNVVKMIQIGDKSVLELFHGPTLAFKDVAMQLLGNFYEYYLSNENQKINIVVATSGDCGITIMSGTTHNGRLYFSDSGQEGDGFIDYDHQFGNLKLGTRDITRFTIDSSGDVSIGSATNSGSNRLQIVDSHTEAYVNSTDSIFRIINENTSADTNQASISFTCSTTGSGADSAIVSQAENSSGNSNLQFWTDTSNGMSEKLRISSDGQVTIGGELHIGSKLVHDGDTDTHINFSSNTMVVTAGNVTKMNINNTMVEINGVTQREGGRQYSTNSNSTWTNILSFSNASTNGFSFECGVSENNYTTMYKVGGSPNYNSCYFTSDDAGDSNHAHSSDITFRILNDSGTKRLQFKAVSYTTTRYLIAISVWVRSGYVNWS